MVGILFLRFSTKVPKAKVVLIYLPIRSLRRIHMPLETDCDFRLTNNGEVVLDARRAMFLSRIERTGSVRLAALEAGVSAEESARWLDSIREGFGKEVVVSSPDGRAGLTADGRSLLTDFQTRSAMARSQVRNLWKKPWVTTDGIVIVEGQVVLVRRGREPFKGMHALPGGIVEYGERLEECVVREMEEETGLRTRVLDLVGVYSAPDRDPRGHFITLAFNLAPIGGSLRAGDDAAEAALFPLHRLPELAADHRTILSDALVKRYSYRSELDRECAPK
jgi:8-oxo-dGTP diphosphatase